MGAESIEAVTIDGLAVRIDRAKMSDWKTFNILRHASSMNQYEQIDALFQVIEHATDQTEKSIVEHLGGETAQAADVLNLCARIITESTPKN